MKNNASNNQPIAARIKKKPEGFKSNHPTRAENASFALGVLTGVVIRRSKGRSARDV